MIYFQLFWNFFIIGFFSFGGGYAMLPLIENQVLQQGWLTSDQFAVVISISGMLPGSIGMNAATFVGYQTAGLLGAIIATIGMVLPSLILVSLCIIFFKRFQNSTLIGQVLYGLRPVIVGLIIFAAINYAFSFEMLQAWSFASLQFVSISIGALFFLIRFKSHPLTVIAFSAITGIILFY